MADNLTAEQRARNMSNIRSHHSKPEKLVRSLLHRLGYRFRLHSRSLPGNPDIVLPKYSAAILVHGCFWHRHPGCRGCTTPKTNLDYWLPKLEGNAERDKRHKKALAELGWKVLIVWECEIRNRERLKRKLLRFLKSSAS